MPVREPLPAPTEWGTFRPKAIGSVLVSLSRNSIAGRGALRKAVYAAFKRAHSGPVDCKVWGTPVRLYKATQLLELARLLASSAEGLTLDMYAYQIVAGNDGQDLAEINTLNHYIGMKPIAQADFLEMKVIPFAIGAFSLLTLRAVVIGRIISLVDLVVLFFYFGAFSLASFVYRLYSYGHHLDPQAPMKIKPFMPVVIGSQQIANFVQTSIPLAGTICMAAFLLLLLAAIASSVREARREAAV